MAAIAITGAGSGIGAATRARLQRAGKRVVGVDLHGAEIVADLAKASGRAHAAKEILAASERRPRRARARRPASGRRRMHRRSS